MAKSRAWLVVLLNPFPMMLGRCFGRHTAQHAKHVHNLQFLHSKDHSSAFTLTKPLSQMASAVQLLVTTTPDPTDTEAVATPLEFVFHAPPVSLILPSSSNNFLLPKIGQDSQGLHAWCGGDRVDTVTGKVEDLRFQVEAKVICDEQSCAGSYKACRKEFRVYYNKTNPYCGSRCHTYPYIPWYNDFDLAVSHSARECLHKAVVNDNASALNHTIQTMVSCA